MNMSSTNKISRHRNFLVRWKSEEDISKYELKATTLIKGITPIEGDFSNFSLIFRNPREVNSVKRELQGYTSYCEVDLTDRRIRHGLYKKDKEDHELKEDQNLKEEYSD
jgi:hypothetical protein